MVLNEIIINFMGVMQELDNLEVAAPTTSASSDGPSTSLDGPSTSSTLTAWEANAIDNLCQILPSPPGAPTNGGQKRKCDELGTGSVPKKRKTPGICRE